MTKVPCHEVNVFLTPSVTVTSSKLINEQAVGGKPPQYAPPTVTLTFDLLTLKVVSESRVTWATFVPILVFLGLSVLDLGPMYATVVRQTDRRQTPSSFNAPPRGRGYNK